MRSVFGTPQGRAEQLTPFRPESFVLKSSGKDSTRSQIEPGNQKKTLKRRMRSCQHISKSLVAKKRYSRLTVRRSKLLARRRREDAQARAQEKTAQSVERRVMAQLYQSQRMWSLSHRVGTGRRKSSWLMRVRVVKAMSLYSWHGRVDRRHNILWHKSTRDAHRK